MKKKIQTILPHFLQQQITRLNKCRNLHILRLEPQNKNKKLPFCKKKLYHCFLYHPVPSLLLFFFLFSAINLQTHTCFFSTGRVSIKTHISRKSIGKIDNQMNSSIELELGAINLSVCTRFWAWNAIPHQTSTTMTHLKVFMIIISCWDCTLLFNDFIIHYTYGGFGKIVERRNNI